MVDKKFIADNWLPRYTGMQLSEFGEYILLTNFKDYVFNFAKIVDAEVRGISHPMQSAQK